MCDGASILSHRPIKQAWGAASLVCEGWYDTIIVGSVTLHQLQGDFFLEPAEQGTHDERDMNPLQRRIDKNGEN